MYNFQLGMNLRCAFLLVFTCVLCCCNAIAQNGIEEGPNYKNNTLIRFPTNAFRHEFKDSLCLVSRGGKFGIVDSTGREVVPLIYDEISIDFSHREEIYYQLIFANELFYYFWQDGNESQEEYARLLTLEQSNPRSCLNLASKFKSEPLFPVRKGNEWGVINKRNEVIIPIQYDRVQEFGQDLFLVKRNGKSGIINSENNILVPLTCDTIESMIMCPDRMSGTDLKDPGSYAVLKRDTLYGAINLFTQASILPKYNGLEICYFEVELGCACGFNPHLHWPLYSPSNNYLYSNVIRYQIDGKLGLLNIATMTELTPPLYDSINFNRGGILGYSNIVGLNNKYTILMDQNTTLHPHFYEDVQGFVADPIFEKKYKERYTYFFKIKNKGRYEILDQLGEPFIASSWEDVISCIEVSDSFNFEFLVKRKGKLGVVNSANKVVVPVKYDTISHVYDNGHFYLLMRKNRVKRHFIELD